jgi:hypothetical protein
MYCVNFEAFSSSPVTAIKKTQLSAHQYQIAAYPSFLVSPAMLHLAASIPLHLDMCPEKGPPFIG